MGLFSKKKDEGDDNNRSALFGSRKKDSTPAANPYAAAPNRDPYAQQQPPPAYSGNDSYRQEKTPAVTGPGQQYSGGSYGSQGGSYGGQSGYGGDRYGARGPSGYGGLGRTESSDTDTNRNDLFGNAPQRQQVAQPSGYGQPAYGQSNSGPYADANARAYGENNSRTYGDTKLTAEEQEEEDVDAMKQQMKYMKQQDISSLDRMEALLAEAEQSGNDTLSRLTAQGERINNTERNLDLAAVQNRIAEDKARELKGAAGSMFRPNMHNPFTAKKREEEYLRQTVERNRADRDTNQATKQAAINSATRQQNYKLGYSQMGAPGKKSTLADRSKFQFEGDESDDEREDRIDQGLARLELGVGRLSNVAKAINKEAAVQNTDLDRLHGKTDNVDDQIAANRARLDRIK